MTHVGDVGETSHSRDGSIADGRDVVGAVDFGGSKTVVAIADPAGRELARKTFTTPGGSADSGPGATAESAVDRAIAELRRLVGTGSLGGIGVVCPGIIEADGIRLAPHVAGWESLRLPAAFGQAFRHTPAVFDNDVKASAMVEARIGRLRGADPGLLVNVGTGIAMAVTVGGTVVRGAHGWAGEVGYGPGIGMDGARAPLEALIGGAALSEVAAAQGMSGTRELIDAALADPDLGEHVALSFEPLTDALLSACLLIDPRRIVISGGLLAAADLWWRPVTERLATVLPDAPEIVTSSFGSSASLQGALLLARRAAALPPMAAEAVPVTDHR